VIIPIIETVFKLLDKVIPDPQAKAAAQQKILELQQQGEFKELENRYEAITSEAKSADPFTSRARPSFMYVFYTVILSLTIFAPILGLINADAMHLFFTNVKMGFEAIPDIMWNTFLMGYVGYTLSRTYEKGKGIK